MSWTTQDEIIFGLDVTEDLQKIPEEKIDDFWDALCKTSEYICDMYLMIFSLSERLLAILLKMKVQFL